MDENLDLWGVYCMHSGAFNLENDKVILGSFGALFTKFAHNSTMGHRRADENLGVGGLCSMYNGIFDLEHVKVIWSHLGHFYEIRV